MNFLRSQFFRSTGTYLGANLLNALLAFVLVPILTRYLTPYDYGVTATATVIVQVLTMLVGLNAYGLIAREQFTASQESQSGLISASLGLAAILSGIVFLFFTMGGGIVGRLTEFPSSWVWMLAVFGFAQVLQSTTLGLVQSRMEPVRYGVYQLSDSALNLGFSILLVVGWGMDWRGRMLALLVAALGMSALYFRELTSRLHLLRWRMEKTAVQQLIQFGFPLIPHSIGGWVMTMSPRLFLNHLANVADTGLYSVAFNLTCPMSMVMGAATRAYVPALFQKLAEWEAVKRERSAVSPSGRGFAGASGQQSAGSGSDSSPLSSPVPAVERLSSVALAKGDRASSVERGKVRFCRLLLLVAAALLVGAVLLYLGIRWILPWLVGPKFQAAAPYVFWLALAFAFQGIYFIFGSFVVYSKKTSLMAWRADFLGAIVTLALCPLLVLKMGPVGAAVTSAVAQAVSTIGCITAALQAYPMPWKEAFGRVSRQE